MDTIIEAYASSSDDDTQAQKTSLDRTQGALPPPDVMDMFADSEYDLDVERKRAEEKAGRKPWIRSFRHERGNWPTYVYIPVPNSPSLVRMSEASVEHFRRRLALSWKQRDDTTSAGRGQKRRRGSHSSESMSSREGDGLPDVVLNDMGPSGQQHLSLSKTVVLRPHQIEPFAQAVKEAVTSSRRFTLSIVDGYDVLVNEEKTRSFVCLRVRAGRPQVLQLIDKVDPVMRMFKQPLYYKDPIVHISIASIPGDLGHLVGSSSSEGRGFQAAGATRKARSLAPETGEGDGDGDGDGDESDSEEEHDGVPREVYVDVTSVAFKAGTTVVEAPLVVDVDV